MADIRAMRQPARASPARYLAVFVALLALAALSLLVSRLHLGAAGIAVALAIASAKAGLVIFFFMHLAEHRGASGVAIAVAFTFATVLTLLSVADAAFRSPTSNPPGSEPAAPYLRDPGPVESGNRPSRRLP